MSQYYTVRQTSRNETEVIVPAAANSNGSVVSKPNHLNNPRSLTTTTNPTKVQIVETAVQIDSENGGHHGHHGQARLVNSADHRRRGGNCPTDGGYGVHFTLFEFICELSSYNVGERFRWE